MDGQVGSAKSTVLNKLFSGVPEFSFSLFLIFFLFFFSREGVFGN